MHTFKVHPNNDELYWLVSFCQDRRSMMAKYKRLDVTNNREYGFCAIVMPYTVESEEDGRWVREPVLGYVLFDLSKINGEIVAHEAVHMATAYMRRKRLSLKLNSQINDREERLAYTVGDCAAKVCNKLYEVGIWRGEKSA